ncbi:HEAT repeat domain-containing protein [Nostoc sp.]|uniref:HEAT repeat domain-containing protein n=1 Tax=Nostoc sp. TaxID=1180 RepID=UPI002FF70345
MSNQQEQDNINFLIKQLHTSQDNSVLKQVAERLGFLGAANADVINALIDLVCTTQDEPTRWVGIQSLGKIGTDNNDVIQTLIKQLSTVQPPTRRVIAQNLAKIAVCNEQAITTLANLARSTFDEVTREAIAYTLGYIGKGSQDAIQTLIYLIHNSSYDYARQTSAKSLRRIEDTSQDTINAIVETARTAQEYQTRCTALSILEQIAVGNTDAINKLTEMFLSGNYEPTIGYQKHHSQGLIARTIAKIDYKIIIKLAENNRSQEFVLILAKSLGYVNFGKLDAINALIKLLHLPQYEIAISATVYSLEKIAIGNPDVITVLIEVLPRTHTLIRPAVIKGLSTIGANNQIVLRTLIDLAYNVQDLEERRAIAKAFGKMTVTSSEAVDALTSLMRICDDHNFWYIATETLQKIGIGNNNAIATLIELLPTLKSVDWNAVKTLAEIGVGNSAAIVALTEILSTCQDDNNRRFLTGLLEKMRENQS